MKAAIIGCGNIGAYLDEYDPGFISTHLSAYLDNDAISDIALCDSSLDKMQPIAQKHDLSSLYTDVSKLLEEFQPEIISICTPDASHFPILQEITNCTTLKGIWLEKPMATSLDHAQQMITLCKEKNITLLVNHQRRYDTFYQEVQSRLSELLGDIQHGVCYYSGGIVTTGSHLLDLLCWYFGKPQHAQATPEEHGLRCRLIFENFSILLLPCNSKHYSTMEIDLIGSIGRLDTCNGAFGTYTYRYYPLEKHQKLGNSFLAPSSQEVFEQHPRTFLPNALADLLESISQQKNPQSDGQTALCSLEIISALAYSAEHKKKVSLPFTQTSYTIPKPQGDLKKWKNQQS